MSRSLADARLASVDARRHRVQGRCCVLALGVTTDGVLLEAFGYEPSGRFSGERRALQRLRDEGERR